MKLVVCIEHDKFCLLCENETEAALLGNKWYFEADILSGEISGKNLSEIYTGKNLTFKNQNEEKWLKEVINLQQKSQENEDSFDEETDWFKKVIRKFKNDKRKKKAVLMLKTPNGGKNETYTV
ncbi:MAG: hypothetical protein SOZ27_06230 [Spirochaetia bacterium]|nr:hypothetical protein [Spirochaetia bacterium]